MSDMGGLLTTLLSLEATVTAASASACSNVLPLLLLPTDLQGTPNKIRGSLNRNTLTVSRKNVNCKIFLATICHFETAKISF